MAVYVLSTDDTGAYRIGVTDDWQSELELYEDRAYRVEVHIVDPAAGPAVAERLQTLLQDKAIQHERGRQGWYSLTESELEAIDDILDDPARAEMRRRGVLRRFLEP